MHSLNFIIIAATALVEPVFSANLFSANLKIRQGHPIVENVFLNGLGPYRFLLDTGAQTNQVDIRIARKLGLTPKFRATLVTIAGEIKVVGSNGIEVRVGDATASGQEFLFTDSAVRTISSDIQGVLGQEFLSHFDYLLDLRGKQLVFGSQEVDGARCPFEFADGIPVVTTSLGNLVLDSGAGRLILFSSGADRLALFSFGLAAMEPSLVTAAGLAPAKTLAARPLWIGGHQYGPVESVLVVMAGQHRMDGLLPLSTFRSVYVSNSGKYVVLK